jgi:hypothetical protein
VTRRPVFGIRRRPACTDGFNCSLTHYKALNVGPLAGCLLMKVVEQPHLGLSPCLATPGRAMPRRATPRHAVP